VRSQLTDRLINWPEIARAVRARVMREDPTLLGGEKVEVGDPGGPIIPVRVRVGDRELRLFSTLSSLGTARDVTLQELRIDTFHPFDEETARLLGGIGAKNSG
jgi:hypothetical protein